MCFLNFVDVSVWGLLAAQVTANVQSRPRLLSVYRRVLSALPFYIIGNFSAYGKRGFGFAILCQFYLKIGMFQINIGK